MNLANPTVLVHYDSCVRTAKPVAAIFALVVAVAGGTLAAKTLIEGRSATPSNVIQCPLNAAGWTGRVSGPVLRSSSPLRERKIMLGINAFRRENGLRALSLDPRLSEAARAHSQAMLRGGFFSHDGQTERFSRRLARYTPRSCIAENIAWGTGSYGTGAGIVTAWKHSAGHRRVMLLPWTTRVGVGVRTGSFLGAAGASVATADFAG